MIKETKNFIFFGSYALCLWGRAHRNYERLSIGARLKKAKNSVSVGS